MSLGIVLSRSVLSWVKIDSFILKFPSSSNKVSISFASLFFGGNTLYYVIHVCVFFDNLSRFGMLICSHFRCFFFLNATVAIIPEGLSPNETLCITHVSGGLPVSISLHRNLYVCFSMVLVLTV